MNTVKVEELSYESLAKLVNTKFRVSVGQQDVVALELHEITPLVVASSGCPNSKTYESFSLFFRGSADRVLPQRIYSFECEPLGCFELFIVAIGCDEHGTKYEAVFNRLVPGGPGAERRG